MQLRLRNSQPTISPPVLFGVLVIISFTKKKQDGGDITNPTSNPGYLSFRSFFLYDKGGHVWVKKREKSALPCVKLGGYLFQTSILGFWDVFIDKN